MSAFKEGEIVQLKSGGPKMTVKSVSAMGRKKDELLCQWFAGSKLNTGYFTSESLIKVSEEESKKDAKK